MSKVIDILQDAIFAFIILISLIVGIYLVILTFISEHWLLGMSEVFVVLLIGSYIYNTKE